MRRSRVAFICPNCSKSFEIIKSRVALHKNHYCSLKCLSRYTAKQRSKKLSTREYPFKCGVCKKCGKDIMAKNSNFVKSSRQFCSLSCKTSFQNKGKRPSERSIALSRAKLIERWKDPKYRETMRSPERRKLMSEINKGEKSHFWRGGLTDKNRKLRNSYLVKMWREQVFKRDNYTCQICEARNGNGKEIILNADHIKSWTKYPELRFELSNGRTLCLDCHKKTDNFAYKAQYQL